MITTLNKIREHDPCTGSWDKLLKSLGKTEADDAPLEMVYILDTLSFDDCLWATRSLPEYDKEWRLLACDFAEMVLPIFEKHYPEDKRPRECIDVARRFAIGESTEDEMAAASAARAAWAAASDAARAAARAASAAARDAARDAASDAAWDAARAAARAASAAARDAARDAASDAAWDAARAARAARAAARDAAWAASDAARAAARDAARAAASDAAWDAARDAAWDARAAMETMLRKVLEGTKP